MTGYVFMPSSNQAAGNVNSDGLTKLMNAPYACLVSAPEGTGSSHRACRGNMVPMCPGRSSSTLTSSPSHKVGPALNIYVFAGTDGQLLKLHTQPKLVFPPPAIAARIHLRLPGGEYRHTTAEVAPALRDPREQKAKTFLCKQ